MPRSWLFQLAAVLGAFLLFLVQPLMASQLLPWFGGAPAVWSASLLFFQVGLFAGYLYVHLLSRWPARAQSLVHVALLVSAALTLPILVSPAWKPAGLEPPFSRVVLTLAATAGAPYVVLAATAPLLQHWWRQSSGREPYRLYALSNIGSLGALFAYPFVVEPAFTVPAQSALWSIAFLVFAGVCAATAWTAARTSTGADRTDLGGAPAGRDWLMWIVLSACGSGLLLAITNQLCQDVAVVPLLWIAPLAVYLATFVLTFGGVYPRRTARVLFGAGVLASLLVTAFARTTPLLWQIAAFLGLLAGACLVCHGELVASRPSAPRLTSFFLALSGGGALGGAFVALVAPHVFTSFMELPLLAIVAVMVAIVPPPQTAGRADRASRLALPLIWIGPAVAVALAVRGGQLPLTARDSTIVDARRSFFGVLRVIDHRDSAHPWRGLYHGRVLHGLQALNHDERLTPAAYYAPGSGVGIAFEEHSKRRADAPMRVGVIGLGAGMIAAWGRSGDDVHFFEINPQVVDLAQRDFTFLRESLARTSVTVGDARLLMEREVESPHAQPYDLLIVDAFSGDSVPTHLLTRECFALYERAVSPAGVLLFHVSNRHLDLRQPIRGWASAAGRQAIELTAIASSALQQDSEWMFLSRDAPFLARVIARGAVASVGPSAVWTDHYSALLPLIR